MYRTANQKPSRARGRVSAGCRWHPRQGTAFYISLPRARGRVSAGCQWHPRQGTAFYISLPRARGRASAGCRWHPRQGTALAVDEVLKPHYFSECDLKCTMRLRTQNKNHTIYKSTRYYLKQSKNNVSIFGRCVRDLLFFVLLFTS